MTGENSTRSGNGADLDPNEILNQDFNQDTGEDDDIDFELSDIVEEGEEFSPGSAAEEEETAEFTNEDTGLTLEDIVFGEESEEEPVKEPPEPEPQEKPAGADLALDKTAQGEAETSFGEFEEDIDFELDDILEETIEGLGAEKQETGDKGLSLDKTARGEAEVSFEDIEEDIDFELEEVIEEATNLPGDKAPLEEDIDFEQQDILDEPAGETGAEPGPIEERDDFELDLEDTFKSTEAEASRAEGEVETGFDAAAELVDQAEKTPSAFLSEAGPDAEAATAAGAEIPALNQERLEEIVRETVRETVSRTLEGMLPRVIEEVVTRELEKLRAELEET